METKKEVIDIWSKFNFTQEVTPSVFNYLKKQIEPLEQKTRGRLTMEYSFVDESTLVYIVAPSLGGYRRKFLVIKEEDDKNFPVSIWSTITDELFVNVDESNFIKKVTEIIQTPLVTDTILSLYQMATDNVLNNHG